MQNLTREEKYMLVALDLAKKSLNEGEVPVGAVIVFEDRIIATGRNRREKNKNALCHAEVEAINNACKVLGGWRLFDCEMFVTLEPCVMCSGSILNSRIKKVVVGCDDIKAGACRSVVNIFNLGLNHKPQFEYDVLKEQCQGILNQFFKELRDKKSVSPKLCKSFFKQKKDRPLVVSLNNNNINLSLSLASGKIVSFNGEGEVLVNVGQNKKMIINNAKIQELNNKIEKELEGSVLSVVDLEKDYIKAIYKDKEYEIQLM